MFRKEDGESISFTSLSSSPPDPNASHNHEQRQQELTGSANQGELSARHSDPAIILLFRTDGNQVFVRGQPVHRVQGQVAVAIEIDERVGCPRWAHQYAQAR